MFHFRMYAVTCVSLLFLANLAATVSIESDIKSRVPQSVMGICHHIGTFYIPEVRLSNEWYTKVHMRQGGNNIVVKVKVGLKDICKNLTKVMGEVEDDLRRMLFLVKKKNGGKMLL